MKPEKITHKIECSILSDGQVETAEKTREKLVSGLIDTTKEKVEVLMTLSQFKKYNNMKGLTKDLYLRKLALDKYQSDQYDGVELGYESGVLPE